jgi:hypothetical protein
VASRSRIVLIATLLGCGGGNNAGPPADGGSCGQEPIAAGDAACGPALAACWAPAWKPPNAPAAGVCTEAQVTDLLAKCWGDTFDPDCDVFERDPANAACLACIFSTEEDPRYGAVIHLASRRVRTNEAGCMALVDGDMSATGCGAKLQASQQCSEAACARCAVSEDQYDQCWEESFSSSCVYVLADAVCWRRPIYAICTRYNTFQEAFAAMARIFCIDGKLP